VLRAVYVNGTVVNANKDEWPIISTESIAKGRNDIPCHPDQSLTSRTLPIPPSFSLRTLRADLGPFRLLANNPLFSERDAATMTRSSKMNIVNDSSFLLVLLEADDGDR
jgi:hypothetical protein